MTRRLLNLLTALSLLLCVAVCVLWVRSYWVTDLWWFTRAGWALGVEVPIGSINFAWRTYSEPPELIPLGFRHITHRPPQDVSFWSHTHPHFGRTDFDGVSAGGYGFGCTFDRIGGDRIDDVTLPLWFVTLCTLVAPGTHGLRAVRRNAHRRSGRCPSCGYDLRATPDRCPECGRAFTTG
jgi:hypothetical protein